MALVTISKMSFFLPGKVISDMLLMRLQAVVHEVSNFLVVVALPSFRSCLLRVDIHRSGRIRCLWASHDVCGLTGGGGSLWFGLADRLTCVSDNWVHLAGVIVHPLTLHDLPKLRHHLQQLGLFPNLSDQPPTHLGRQPTSHSLSWTLI